MKLTIKIFLMAIITLFLFSSCAKRSIVITHSEVKRTQINTWAQQTNVREDVDISDLEESQITPISRTTVQESEPNKMERVHFPLDEYNRLAKVGNGTVKGTIYLKNAYDKRVYGANTRLYLNPVTSYSKQWYYESYLGGHKMQKADNRLFNYLRFTSANTQGQFAFYGVPTGRYYLIGTVKCAGECGYSTPKNIRIATEVSVSGNQVVQKELSRLMQ